MGKTSVVFLGSKPVGYRCLEHLLTQAPQLDLELAAVLSNERPEFGGSHDIPGLAAAHGIPLPGDPDLIPECDLIISVQYHRILTPAQLARARRLAVNLHMAPLPEYRGSNQFTHAILEEKAEFGTTLHIMDARIDHGPILAQRRWPLPQDIWVEELYARTVEESVALFQESLPALVSGSLAPVPQQTLEAEHGTALHLRAEMSTLKALDFSWSPEKFARQLRATYMPGFEPPYAMINGRKIFLVPETTA